VEDKVRAVFWLTEREAAELPRRAPDFWAFRHWVVEFLEAPRVEQAAQRAGELAWRGFEERLPPEERKARIDLRERLLAELPETEETAAARAELHYTLGGLCHWDRKYEKALAHFRVAHDLAERLGNTQLRAWSLNGLGNVYDDLGRYEEAIAAYQRAIELDPEVAYLHNNLGNVYRAQGRHEEAIAAYQQAIDLDPEFAYPHNNLGNVYADLGRYEEAIAAYQRAIALDPEDAVYHYNLGIAYQHAGRYEEAIAAYQRAIDLDPGNAAFQASFAAVCRELGREKDYEQHIHRARELMANESDYNKACIESIAGNADAALKYLAKALERAPGDCNLARRDPDLAFIRDDPRFQALVEKTTSDERNTR
jgi:tetratricopeptide (TPR) repeat protein